MIKAMQRWPFPLGLGCGSRAALPKCIERGFLVDVQSFFSPLDTKVSSSGLFWLQVTETQLALAHIEFIGLWGKGGYGRNKELKSELPSGPQTVPGT